MGIGLAVHLLAAGTWLGCVMVEIVFERALATQEQWTLLARLHGDVDRWIELPALTLVTLTGVGMLQLRAAPGDLSAWLVAKIAFGLLAVLANLYCAVLVFRRYGLARAGDLLGVRRVDHLQHRIGALVLIGLSGAVVCGLVIVW